MLRSRKQQAASSNGSSSSLDAWPPPSSRTDPDEDPRGRSKSIIPKSLIGTLVVASVLFLILLGNGSLSNDASRINQSSSSNTGSKQQLLLDNHSAQDGGGIGNNNIYNKQLRNAEMQNNNNIVNHNNNILFNSATNNKNTTSPTTGATLHIIFSTDCGSYQHWQSYLFFHRAYTIHQPGYITRIASGCTDKELEYEKAWHQEHVSSVMSDRFRIHFTPHFSRVKDESTGEVMGDYKYFNKPFGLKHFLENHELLGMIDSNNNNDEEVLMKHPNDIIILCDPDFALLRPITDDFSNPKETLVGPRRKAHFNQMSSHIVTHGQPYAQTYGLGTQWRQFNLDEIAGVDSPAKEVSQKDGGMFYPVGPPYIGTASDMHKIAVAWSEFAPRVHKEYPHLLAEMVSSIVLLHLQHCHWHCLLLSVRPSHNKSLSKLTQYTHSPTHSLTLYRSLIHHHQFSYCIAAAHLKLPHTLIDSLMISSPGAGGEGWRHISQIPPSETCSNFDVEDDNHRPLPNVLHYCQRYMFNGYFWGKRKIPHTIFTCDHPLFSEPPSDYLAVSGLESTDKGPMNAFVICAMTRFVNDAMVFFKESSCEGGGNRERKALVPFVNLRNQKKGGGGGKK